MRKLKNAGPAGRIWHSKLRKDLPRLITLKCCCGGALVVLLGLLVMLMMMTGYLLLLLRRLPLLLMMMMMMMMGNDDGESLTQCWEKWKQSVRV